MEEEAGSSACKDRIELLHACKHSRYARRGCVREVTTQGTHASSPVNAISLPRLALAAAGCMHLHARALSFCSCVSTLQVFGLKKWGLTLCSVKESAAGVLSDVKRLITAHSQAERRRS